MILDIQLPLFGQEGGTARIRAVHAHEGDHIQLGTALLDVSVDFGGGMSFDCQPVSHFRIVSREAGWLLRFEVRRGDDIASGTRIGLLGSEAGISLDAAPVRPARLTVASMLEQDTWWDHG